MKKILVGILILIPLLGVSLFAASPKGRLSEETKACLECHNQVTPGIVKDWEKGRHAGTTPAEGLKKSRLEKRVSSDRIPAKWSGVAVGCAECHALNPDKHKDTFEHNGFKIHTVVTPKDCALCHGLEVKQYEQNIMNRAYGNLKANPIYNGLADQVNGVLSFKDGKIIQTLPDVETNNDSCYHCHGTLVEVKGSQKRETSMGEMEFPLLSGWPNQGVGRVNPDGSLGSCAACHTRHAFAIEMARKPYTCSQCHKGPDVPAFKVYTVSKHGNTFSAFNNNWNFKNVPWKVGKDFTAPTCAACHISLIVKENGEIVSERTHQMNDRLAWRLFGLIYAHPHPRSPDTTIIRNKAGLPLPTDLDGGLAAPFLIDSKDQERRWQTMQKTCLACHNRGWVEGQFRRLKNTIQTTNQMTLTATQMMHKAWEMGLAKGLDRQDSLFNEPLEKKWVEQWLFYANSVRFASAMMGADYGAFANGRWYLSKTIAEMQTWLKQKIDGGEQK